VRIEVEAIGLPVLAARLGGVVSVEPQTGTLAGLVAALAERFGAEVSDFLLDQGGLDPDLLLVVNGREVLGQSSIRSLQLADGDRVNFIMMVGGG